MNQGVGKRALNSLAMIAATAPQTYDVLRWVGLERRRTRMARAAAGFGWFGVGMAVGSGLALLLTPHDGPEMRRRLSDQVRRARDASSSIARGDGPDTRPTA